MAVQLQTLIDRSIRNMGSGIHPVVKESAIEVVKRAYGEGIYVQITSGFRSFEEQNKLYAQGRTDKSKPIVTNARGGESNHNYGLAIDYVIVSEDGRRALWTVNDQWRRVAVIAKSLGFAWGGDWTSFPDFPHLEMMGGLTISQLKAGRQPNLVSKVPKVTIAKEDEWMAEKFEVSNKTLENSVVTVLARFEQKDPALAKIWRERFNSGELTNGDAIGILYHAVFNGWITGIQK
ncbi:M15 family metallopeptidase [Bacillus infantis]|uniref:M15 family metallopeptidase n=1 Tax=Bacillus infantis TaxID=324767 RepID=UPI00344FEE6A